jgi:hypothetical protein
MTTTREEYAKLKLLIEQAEARGIHQATDAFVKDENRLCVLAAIYAVATGIVPYHWNESDVKDIIEELSDGTGIDFSQRTNGIMLYYRIIRASDYAHFSFRDIALMF